MTGNKVFDMLLGIEDFGPNAAVLQLSLPA